MSEQQNDPQPASKGSNIGQVAEGFTAQAGRGGIATVDVANISYRHIPPRPVDGEVLQEALQALERLPSREIPAPAPLPHGSRMPLSRNPLFVGREDELRTLANFMTDDTTIDQVTIGAITGMGGSGKTQLASEFVHRYGQYFSGSVFWLSFADPTAIPAEVAACGGAGAMDLRPDFSALQPEDQVREVMSAWQSALPRLLVFDGCEDEALLARWRPPTGGCRVLVTSRREQWDPVLQVRTLPLADLRREQSIELLRKHLPDLSTEQEPYLNAIARELGDLPLAMELAGNFLHRYREVVEPADYLSQLSQPDFLQHRSLQYADGISPTGGAQDIARTFALSYERLDTDDPVDNLAVRLLATASGFPPGEPISRELLSSTLGLPNDPDTALLVEDALDRLKELGLLQVEESGELRLHRLLATFVRDATADVDIGATVGPSTHIASDVWTLEDALGYRAYAYAIYRFMTHQLTRPPLTISIQASWGGGKTSLMRMIQQSLDPEALRAVRQGAFQPRGEITVKQVLGEVENWIQKNTRENLPSVPPPAPEAKDRKLLTVWFNAWKYENTKEVWAGLADAIMQQVAARLPLAERELFWLRLNLKRIDADLIRRRIYERIFSYWWHLVRGFGAALIAILLVSVLVTLTGSLAGVRLLQILGWSGISSSTVTTAIVAVSKYINAKNSVESEPAAASLSDYLDIPDYSAELGFVHHVEADLQRVLDSLPTELVIFIDDLDRCSPAKVAEVVEAVNLFLGGDFPNCFFIIGMDAEMVAASLQAAHRDMIDNLPVDAGIPIGWRFMDKFVQLPFLIPPAEKDELTRYTSSLFSRGDSMLEDAEIEQLASQAATNINSMADVPEVTERLQEEHNLDETRSTQLKARLEVQQKLDEGIGSFSDRNPEIIRVISEATSYFQGNPRELKRFINAFRFQYFLWWARRAQGLEGPTLDQLLRWTVLSMRWPEVVRWLRRSGGDDWQAATAEGVTSGEKKLTAFTRLQKIEEISGEASDMSEWHQQADDILHLTPSIAAWLNDDDLFQFFHEEVNEHPEGQRLSDGAGKGLW